MHRCHGDYHTYSFVTCHSVTSSTHDFGRQHNGHDDNDSGNGNDAHNDDNGWTQQAGEGRGLEISAFWAFRGKFFFLLCFFFTYYSNGYIHVDFVSIHPSSTSSPLTSYKQPRPPLPSHLVVSICQRKSVSGAWRHDMSRAQCKFFYLFFLPFANYYNSHMYYRTSLQYEKGKF